ncbi:MAG: MBL fold metallo-hydrolase [Bacillota bacterium]
MKLTVLGKYSPFPPAGGAGPGYWVQFDDEMQGILLDCGPGVLSRFQETVGPLRLIRHVILSHLHFDHTSDFHALRYAASPDRRYKDLPQHITIYAPGFPDKEASLISYKQAVDAQVVEAGKRIDLGQGDGAVSIMFFPDEHAIPCYAVRIEGRGGTIVYSGDSRPCESLVEAARGADLFLCEASATEEDAAFAAAGHLTARQAGEVAKRAGVRRLLLTHLWPLYDENVLLEECRRVFPDAEIAGERATYTV